MDPSIIISSLYGAVLGIAVGIIPGIAPAHLMSIMFMALFAMSPIEVACFYIGILTVSQYVDSIPAIYFGVPGETSAVPASYEGPHLRRRGLGQQAIKLTAVGRVIACVIGVCLCVVVIPVILQNPWFFSNNVQLGLLTLAMIGIFASGQGTRLQVLLSMALGYCLGMVGFSYYSSSSFMTFGHPGLFDGIPLICALLGLYVVPQIIRELRSSWNNPGLKIVESAQEQSVPVRPHLANMVQSSFIGWFTGLIPGLSYVMSSTFSYNWQKKRQQRSGQYQPGNMPCIVSAETANTAGAVSTLIPLMVFGIPITWSESIVYNVMVMNNADFSQGQFFSANMVSLVTAFVIANVIGVVACWPLAGYIARILNYLDFRALWIAVLTISLAAIVYMGSYYNQLGIYLATFLVCLFAGSIMARLRLDPMPAVFVFLIQNKLELSFFTFTQLYF